MLRRDRTTGQVAIGLAGLLLVSALVYGVGMASATYKLSDVGAWLAASTKGMVVHANGLAGKVDGKADVLNTRNHKIKIIQDGRTVLIVDETTGVVSRIDPSQLKVQQSRSLGVGLQVVAGSGIAYTVDSLKGTVQRIDPVSLAAIGPASTLKAPLGRAALDPKGTLWVPTPQDGRLVPFHGGAPGTPVQAGRGGTLGLSIVAGNPVAVDSGNAVAAIVRPEGVQQVTLPDSVRQSAGNGGVKIPATVDGLVVPMLGAGGDLTLLDTGTGDPTSVGWAMPRHRLGEPQILGAKVYVPDESAGSLLVYNHVTRRPEKPIRVAGPGPLDVFVKDGLLWANDPDGASAVSIDRDGVRKTIRKYDDKVPGSVRRPVPDPVAGGRGGETGTGGDDGGARHVRPPKLTPGSPPSAPLNVQATGDGGVITVTFQESAHLRIKPDGYVLRTRAGTPEPKARPAEVKRGSEYRFTIPGLQCGVPYTYRIAVRYTDPRTRRPRDGAYTQFTSPACKEAGAPASVTAAGADGAIKVGFSQGDDPAEVRDYIVTDEEGQAIPNVRPAARNGPFEFTIGGLDCAREYTYNVAARYLDGGKLKQALSPRPATARPCKSPIAVTGLRATGVNHGAELSWAKTPGYDITYEVTSPKGTATTKATSYKVTGLPNNGGHDFTVVAKNGAGSSQPGRASVTLDPAAHAATYNGHNNENTNTYLHTAAGLNAPRAGSFPQGFRGQVKVICQVASDSVTDENDSSLRSTIWDKIEYNGETKWVSDLYVATPKSNAGAFSDPPLWGCE